MSLNEITDGSNVICATSAWPVLPSQTCRYVGFSNCPPEYPETTSSTPLRSSKTASTHQKHPAASVAVSILQIKQSEKCKSTCGQSLFQSVECRNDLMTNIRLNDRVTRPDRECRCQPTLTRSVELGDDIGNE